MHKNPNEEINVENITILFYQYYVWQYLQGNIDLLYELKWLISVNKWKY